ncbi:Mur ligase family protein [Chlamydiota bacterium]
MNHPGELKKLAGIAKPTIALLSTISSAHIGFFKNIRAIAAAKEELFQQMEPNSIGIFNTDNPWIKHIYNRFIGKKHTFGIKNNADFKAHYITFTQSGKPVFSLYEKGKKIARIRSPLPGKHNLYNLLGALAIARLLSLSYDEIFSVLPHLCLPPLRWETHKHKNILFILDSYNANPQSMENGLETFLKTSVEGKKICILGDMHELGGHAKKYHYLLGKKLGRSQIEHVITYGTFSDAYKRGFLETGNHSSFLEAGNHYDIALALAKISKKGDTVFIKGSRKCYLEKVLTEFKNIF